MQQQQPPPLKQSFQNKKKILFVDVKKQPKTTTTQTTATKAGGASGIIRLLDAKGTNLLDSISTDMEDSFSLDSFGELILAHSQKKLLSLPSPTPSPSSHYAKSPLPSSMIIARVKSFDPKNPSPKPFYSYYDAWNLNKILFQTQRVLNHEDQHQNENDGSCPNGTNTNYTRLIHRINVLNPLTNTDIIGDVEYWKIDPTTAMTATVKVDEESSQSSFLKTFCNRRKSESSDSRRSSIIQQVYPPELVQTILLKSPADGSGISSAPVKSVHSPIVLASAQYTNSTQNISSPNSSSKEGSSKKKFSLDASIYKSATRFGSPIAATTEATSDENSFIIQNTRRCSLLNSNSDSADIALPRFQEWKASLVNSPATTIKEEEEEKEGGSSPPLPVTTFDAVFIGTDDDYLNKSSFRSLFKKHALIPEDVVLFELPPELNLSEAANGVVGGSRVSFIGGSPSSNQRRWFLDRLFPRNPRTKRYLLVMAIFAFSTSLLAWTLILGIQKILENRKK